MPGVVAALDADDRIGAAVLPVDDLALAPVAPLRSDDGNMCHDAGLLCAGFKARAALADFAAEARVRAWMWEIAGDSSPSPLGEGLGWGPPALRKADGPHPLQLGSGPINCAVEASKWRRYWVWVDAAGSIATRKAAQAQDRSHFDVPSGFDRFCPERRQKVLRSEEHTAELQSLMRSSYAVFFLKKKKVQ